MKKNMGAFNARLLLPIVSLLLLSACGRAARKAAPLDPMGVTSGTTTQYSPISANNHFTPTPTPTPTPAPVYYSGGVAVVVVSSPTPTPSPSPAVVVNPPSYICPEGKNHAKEILASTHTPGYGNPASAVLGDIKPRDGSVNFENEDEIFGFVKVAFATHIVNGPGADFIVHIEGQDEAFAVYVWDTHDNRILVAEVAPKYAYNTAGSLDLLDLAFDLEPLGVSEIKAIEIRNREDRPSWHMGEGPDLRGFTALYCN